MSLFAVELVCRAYFSFLIGPSILLYGTEFNQKNITSRLDASSYNEKTSLKGKAGSNKMRKAQNRVEGYAKYFPKQIRYDFDVETGERFLVTINSSGFRGDEFKSAKPQETIRVVTLGASSTFGYFDRDDETYPVYLEAMLNSRYREMQDFEVINLGIPHLQAAEISQLFMNEAIDLDPDVITFYEGNNDADYGPMPSSLLTSRFTLVLKKMGKALITVDLVDSLLDSRREIQFSSNDIKRRQAASDRFIDSIARINDKCRKRGIIFIVGNQQKTSQLIPRQELPGVTYEEEVRMVEMTISHDQTMNFKENQLLMHSHLMADLKTWASANDVPFVDIISRLDNDRDVLVSSVHLSPKGNRMVAEAFSEEISRRIYKSPEN